MSPVKSPQELTTPDVGKKDKLVVQKSDEEDLPPGWTMDVKTRKGSKRIKKDRYYTDPVTGYVFRSLVDVQRYLKTGSLGRLATKPKITETDKKTVDVIESKEQITAVSNSSPATETPKNKRPLEDASVTTKSKSELPQRFSKRLAGIINDAPPPENKKVAAPPVTPPVPKTRHAKNQAGMEIEPPLTTPPGKATKVAGKKTEPPPPPSSPPPPPPPPSSSLPEPKTRPPVVLAMNNKKPKTENDKNADVAAKLPENQENLEKDKKDEITPVKNQDLHPKTAATLPPASQPQPPKPAIVPPSESLIPTESVIPTADSGLGKQELPIPNPTQEYDFWTDPCIEFAVKTLTGAIPFGELNKGELNKADNFPVSPLEVSMDSLWTDPCIEFAVKTLTGAIPVEDLGIQDYLHHQTSTSSTSEMGMNFCQSEILYEKGNNKQGDLQKGGNIGFHQQVSGSNNGQFQRQRFF